MTARIRRREPPLSIRDSTARTTSPHPAPPRTSLRFMLTAISRGAARRSTRPPRLSRFRRHRLCRHCLLRRDPEMTAASLLWDKDRRRPRTVARRCNRIGKPSSISLRPEALPLLATVLPQFPTSKAERLGQPSATSKTIRSLRHRMSLGANRGSNSSVAVGLVCLLPNLRRPTAIRARTCTRRLPSETSGSRLREAGPDPGTDEGLRAAPPPLPGVRFGTAGANISKASRMKLRGSCAQRSAT